LPDHFLWHKIIIDEYYEIYNLKLLSKLISEREW